MSDQPLTYIPAIQSQIGLALRMALENGMHTEMRSKQVGEAMSQRCRKVWWTVCILDRQMCSPMGVPMAIADECNKCGATHLCWPTPKVNSNGHPDQTIQGPGPNPQ